MTWVCTCGQSNAANLQTCSRCGRERSGFLGREATTVPVLQCAKCGARFAGDRNKAYKAGVLCSACQKKGGSLVGVCHPTGERVDEHDRVIAPDHTLRCHRTACDATAHPLGYNRETHGMYCRRCVRDIHEANPGMELFPYWHLLDQVPKLQAAGGMYRTGIIIVKPKKVVEVPNGR